MQKQQRASSAWDHANLQAKNYYIVHGLRKQKQESFSYETLKLYKECHLKYFKGEIVNCTEYVHQELVKYLSYANILSVSIISQEQHNVYAATGFVLKIMSECYAALYPVNIYSPTYNFSPMIGQEKNYKTPEEELKDYLDNNIWLKRIQQKYNVKGHLDSSPEDILGEDNGHNELLVMTNPGCIDIIGVFTNKRFALDNKHVNHDFHYAENKMNFITAMYNVAKFDIMQLDDLVY